MFKLHNDESRLSWFDIQPHLQNLIKKINVSSHSIIYVPTGIVYDELGVMWFDILSH